MLCKHEQEWIKQRVFSEITKVVQLTQAITNLVFLISFSDKSQLIFKRLNKTALSENERKNEVLVHKRAFQEGLTGKIIAVSNLYCLQGYLQGESLQGTKITEQSLNCLSDQLSRVHQLSPSGVINQNLTKALLTYCSDTNNPQFEQQKFDKYLALANRLDNDSALDCLCHSDLSFANLLINEKQDIYILDWEYAVRGCRAYDVGICCVNNELDKQQSASLIDEYYSKNKQQIKQTNAVFKAECEDYSLLFNYINTGWHLCHNA